MRIFSTAYLPMIPRPSRRRLIRGLAVVACLAVVAGCHGILDVSDPTLIQSGDIANNAGANAQRLFASTTFMSNMTNVIRDVAYFTDEWTYDVLVSTSTTNNRTALLDLRDSQGIERTAANNNDLHLGWLSKIYWQTSLAIKSVDAYAADSVRSDYLGQLYGIRGYVILQMAEDICPGFPINDVKDDHTVYGGPLTTDSAMAWASHVLDSAITYSRDSARFVTLARVVKGRVLLDQGKYDSAAAVVAPVNTEDRYVTENARVSMNSPSCPGCLYTALGNGEGGNGVYFAAPGDPRIPLRFLKVRHTNVHDSLYITTHGLNPTDVTTLASGVEARLIEAEVALHDGSDTWKPILDNLRATVGLDTLVDPGTPASRLDLLYGERARWLLMTGRRLGDMRRLIKNYGRPAESVFPTGLWHGGTGANYSTGTAIPFSLANQRQYNPYITTGCTAR